jgi:predicted transcriptional regulator
MRMSQGMAGAIDEKTQARSFSVAPDATAEINGLFEEWLRAVEDEILEILTKEKSLNPSEVAAKLKISEKSVNFFMDKMKKEGKLKTA